MKTYTQENCACGEIEGIKLRVKRVLIKHHHQAQESEREKNL